MTNNKNKDNRRINLGNNLKKAEEKQEKVTEIVFILDRSGSMQTIKDDAIGGFNTFLAEQKKLEGRANLTLILFNQEVETVIDGVDINEVEELNGDTYSTFGMTALLDGIGMGIDGLVSRFKKYNESSDNVIFAIMTDGAENSSKEYRVNEIKEKIEKMTKEDDWQFIFLGANIDAVGTASNLGINPMFAGQFNAVADGGSKSILRASQMMTTYRTDGVMDGYDVDGDGNKGSLSMNVMSEMSPEETVDTIKDLSTEQMNDILNNIGTHISESAKEFGNALMGIESRKRNEK